MDGRSAKTESAKDSGYYPQLISGTCPIQLDLETDLDPSAEKGGRT
jgi:hypothetical protein